MKIAPTRFALLALFLLLVAGATAQRSSVFNILYYGAKGDGKTVNTLAFRQAIDACAKSGGGTVYVPAGEFVSGTIVLRSHINLYLEAGAVIRGSGDLADYKIESADEQAVDPAFEKFFGPRYGLIWASQAENFSITGPGTIDGNGTNFMDLSKKRIEADFDGQFTRQGKSYMYGDKEMGDGPVIPNDRPTSPLRFIHCKHIVLRDFLIKDSPEWTVHIANADDVDISGVTIRNPLMYANNDGIHFTTCRNIRVTNCDISTGDDAIVVTGFGPKGVSENVTVNNCILQSRSSGIRLGYGKNNMRNAVFQNIVIHGSNRGIGVFTRDGGSIENYLFSNITIETRMHTGHWWGHGEPIHVSAVPSEKDVKPGAIRNVRFSGVRATSENGIVVWGVKGDPIQDLTFDDVHLTVRTTPLSATYGGNFDLRPVLEVAAAIFKHDMPGLFFRYTDRMRVRDFAVEWADAQPDYATHGIEGEYFNDLVIDGFRGRQAIAGGKAAAISLAHGRGVTIRNSEAAEGAGVFFAHEDVSDQRLFVNNDLSKAHAVFQPAKTAFQSYGNALPGKQSK
jgi:hypothetical protein